MSAPREAPGPESARRASSAAAPSGEVTHTAGPAGEADREPDRRRVEAAYERCLVIAREHYENFPVVSRFLPGSSRRALAAVYAFARAADDFADEGYGPGGPSREERLAALDAWERRLGDAVGERSQAYSRSIRRAEDDSERATTRSAPVEGRGDAVRMEPHRADSLERRSAPGSRAGVFPRAFADADAIFIALGDAIERHAIPRAHFGDLLSAFRQDVLVGRYETRGNLLDYCRRSAEPVGRIVLAVHGAREEWRLAASDAITTGLQLANFWQDVAPDRAKDRIYLPREDRERFGVGEEDLDGKRASTGLRALVLEEVSWTRSFFEKGRPLLDDPPPRIGLHLRLVWQGGMRILEKIESVGGDVLGSRPRLGAADVARLLIRATILKGVW